MTDIVKRLRTSIRVGAYHGSPYERGICGRQMTEAADEIERLTSALHDEIRLRQEACDEARSLRASERSAWNAAVERDEQIDRLRAEVAALRKDAERYRGLRELPQFFGWDADYRPDEIDAQVDAALWKTFGSAR
jgi:hypothetical protein